MNRRQLLGAIVGLPAAAAVTRTAAVVPSERLAFAGIGGWIPHEPAPPFFGIERRWDSGVLADALRDANRRFEDAERRLLGSIRESQARMLAAYHGK
jgi:hypothetical protein